MTLEGGKAIAAAVSEVWGFEVSIHRIHRYMTDKANTLPNWKIRGRVYADESEVVVWAKRQPMYKRESKSPPGKRSTWPPYERPPAPARRSAASGVYVVQASTIDRIKIGVSEDVEVRLSALQTASPVPLIHLFTLEGDIELERSLHLRFAAHRLHGEWFQLAGDLQEWVTEQAYLYGCNKR